MDSESETLSETALSPEEIAQQIVLEAEMRAKEILESAQSWASQIEAEAHRAGLSRAEAEANAYLHEELQKLDERAATYERERADFFESIEPELAGLSIEIARKVIKQELQQNREMVLDVVRDTLRRVKEREIRIRVNPHDTELVREHREDFRVMSSDTLQMDVVADRRVGQGGCIVETENGNLDARLDEQLKVIEERIMHAGDEGEDDGHTES